MARRIRNPSIPVPTMPLFVRTASRRAAFRPIGTGAATPLPPHRLDPRVEEAVGEIEAEHSEDQEEGVNCGQADDDRRVEIRNRDEEELAKSRIVENRLRDDRAGTRRDQRECQAGNDGRRSGTEDLLVKHVTLLQPFRPRYEMEILV